MELPIGILSKGAVIWIDFVYEGDPSKSKRRPADCLDDLDPSLNDIIN